MSSKPAEDSSKVTILQKLTTAQNVLQLHAKKTKKVRSMMQNVYSDGEAYIEHGRQMVALISVYAQELSTVDFPQLDSARETLKQVAEFQSKYFDIMRDFNQLFSRDGVKIMENLEARANASKADLKRVEKLNDSLVSTRKKLSKESAGSSKIKELQDTVDATEKAIVETGAEVSDLFNALNTDFCVFGAGFYSAFHENYAQMLNLGKELWDSTEEESKKLGEVARKNKGESSASELQAESSNGNGIDGNMGIALAELVDAERTQVTQLTHLERYNSKLTQEAGEAKPCVDEDTVKEIFKFTKEITEIHREILEEVDFLGNPRKDLTPAEIAAAKAKPHKTVEPDKLLKYIYDVFNPRLDKMNAVYSKYLEHVGLSLGTLERAKRKKSFNSVLHKCQQQSVVYGMFKLGQLMPVVGKYFIGLHRLLQCVLDAGSEVDPIWMDYYEMLQKIGEMNKAYARIREDSENVHILMGIQEKINKCPKELPEVGRAFIGEENFSCGRFVPGKEDNVTGTPMPTLEEDQTYHLMLFNDMLMITQKPQGVMNASQFIMRENYNYIMDLPINKIVVGPIKDADDLKNGFRVSGENLGMTIWCASSAALRDEWVEKIRAAVLNWCNNQVFGASPEALMKRSAELEDGIVPHVFQDALNFVEKEGLALEGIFRISGNARTMELTRLKLNTGHKVQYDSAFNAAVLMKQWLSSLPVPIMQPYLYDKWHEAAEPKDNEECVTKMTALVKDLPKLSKFILYMICDLCRKIVAKTSENLMTYHSLAIVFAPSLMRVPESEEFNSTKRLDTLEKVFLLSDRIFPGVKEEIDEAVMQATVYKEVQMKRKREAVDALRTKHIKEKSVMPTNVVSAAEWMKKRKEELAAQEQREKEEAEARAKKEAEELQAKQIAEYEARLREEEEKRKAEEEAKAKKEQMSREAEEQARKDFEEHEKKVREMAEKAEKAEKDVQDREKAKLDAEKKRRFEAYEAKRKAAEKEAEDAAAKADEYDEDACAGCGEPIDDDDEDAFDALDRTWHADCFVCEHCKKNLADEKTKAMKGRPFCVKCYADLFCPVCFGCNKPITDSVLKALDTTWHKKCFVCAKCGNPITGDFTTTPEGLPICC